MAAGTLAQINIATAQSGMSVTIPLPSPLLLQLREGEPPLKITVAVNSTGMTAVMVDTVYAWVATIRHQFYQGGEVVIGMVPEGGEVVIGMVHDTGDRYINSQKRHRTSPRLFQICIGRMVILLPCYDDRVPDPIRFLFEDARTKVVSFYDYWLPEYFDATLHLDATQMHMIDLYALAGRRGLEPVLSTFDWTGPIFMVMAVAEAMWEAETFDFPYDFESIYQKSGGTDYPKDMKWWASAEKEEQLSQEKITYGAGLAYLAYNEVVALGAKTEEKCYRRYRRGTSHPTLSTHVPKLYEGGD